MARAVKFGGDTSFNFGANAPSGRSAELKAKVARAKANNARSKSGKGGGRQR